MNDRNNRLIAMDWWSSIPHSEQVALTEYCIGIHRKPESLTGREIESLCPKHLLND